MLSSKIVMVGDRPRLVIDGRAVPAMAYTTYFEERSGYKDFLAAGYRIFFVNTSFTLSPINSLTGFTPFRVGIFEDMDNPDYSEFESAVRKILAECPDAIIIPRVYVSMPKWWNESHPDDVVETLKGGKREALFSEAFRRDGAEMLITLINHIKSSDYAARIGGWQICGGLTQEWFHHDHGGSLGKCAEEPFRRWVKENYGKDGAVLPTPEQFVYNGESFNSCENARRYSLFCNLSVAETLDFFAGTVKREVGGNQIVGAFYGYAYQSNSCVLFGTHGLRRLLDSPNLDFFSSPNAYSRNRDFGINWADMIPVDSVKHHGKIGFIECDIRTCLTTGIQEARPGEYPDDLYRPVNGKSVWAGPPTEELSREAIRNCFAHQITKASAIWWFDMWGGWYASRMLMNDLEKMNEIYKRELLRTDAPLSAEVAFFADESGFSNLFNKSPHHSGTIETRTNMGNTGVPYDSLMVEDAEAVLSKYKAAVFAMSLPSEAGKKAMALCRQMNIPYISASEGSYMLSVNELREFFRSCGVHAYVENGDVVYVGNGFVGLHSLEGGRKTLKLPRALAVTPVYGTDVKTQIADVVEFDLNECGTALFEVEEI